MRKNNTIFLKGPNTVLPCPGLVPPAYHPYPSPASYPGPPPVLRPGLVPRLSTRTPARPRTLGPTPLRPILQLPYMQYRPGVHVFTIFGLFSANTCTHRTPIYRKWANCCKYVYAIAFLRGEGRCETPWLLGHRRSRWPGPARPCPARPRPALPGPAKP